jgi:hypothetical protein
MQLMSNVRRLEYQHAKVRINQERSLFAPRREGRRLLVASCLRRALFAVAASGLAAHVGALGGVSLSFTHRAPNPSFQATAYGRA